MIRVGIVDSGIAGQALERVSRAADFTATGPRFDGIPAERRDVHGHGSRVAEIIARCEGVTLLDARVFFGQLLTSAAQAAAAIDWLVAERVQLINLSFGLPDDRAVLRDACARAVAAGTLLVAAVPARGGMVYPAAYPGVIRASGDARCARGEISWIGTANVDFGAHVRWPDDSLAGASAGAAALSAALAAVLCAQPALAYAEAVAMLRATASYQGPERRSAAP